MNPEVLNFFLNLDGEYERFIGVLREKLADHPERLNYIRQYGNWLVDHPLLPKQQAMQPARWIHINLIVQDEGGVGTKATTIAIRDDNVYFIGFKNRDGWWYELGFEGRSARFLQDSTFLGCDVRYGSLFDSGAGLANLDLGKQAMTRVVHRLWAYQPAAGLANAATKRDLARLCFMICEAARMTPHLQRMGGDGWCVGSRFEQRHVDYAQTWKKMSRTLINCALNDLEQLHTLAEFDVVYLVLNYRLPEASADVGFMQRIKGLWTTTPGGGGSSQQGSGSSNPRRPSSSGSSGRTQQQQGQTAGKSFRGRPLVELFSVKINDHDARTVDTIVIYDGKRGQIIYKHGQRAIPEHYRYAYQVPLTGPYRAISAGGSFAIQVAGKTDASDESSQVIGKMSWDCYADDLVYDEVLIGDIISTAGTGRRLAEVTYVVLSDAMEATMEVNLLLTGTTHVHGRINAHYASLDANEVVLFERGHDEKVELVPSAPDSMVPLELGRSVVAVPVRNRSEVSINLRLHVEQPNMVSSRVQLNGCVYFNIYKHRREIHSELRGYFFVPVGWTRGSDLTGAGASHGRRGFPTGLGTGTRPSRYTSATPEQTSVKVQVNMTSPGFHHNPRVF